MKQGQRLRKPFAIEMNELDPEFVKHIKYLSKYSYIIMKDGKKPSNPIIHLAQKAKRVLKENREISDRLERMNGFHNDNLNFSSFIDAFIDANIPAEVTIDGNANSSAHDVCTLMNDMTKPHLKLLAFNKIFYELNKKYGLQDAKDWLTLEWIGALYLHDSATSSTKSYCFAYDLDQLVEKGLFFVNKFPAKPAKHLTTFNNHVHEFISWNCNRTSGAVGLPSYLVYSWWFWWKDVQSGFYLRDPEYYRRQSFQEVIFNLNQPYLRVK